MIVAIVAIVVIVGLGFFALKAFGPGADTGGNGTPELNVDLNGGNGQ